MADPTEILSRYADEILEKEKRRIEEAIRAATDRVIAQIAVVPEAAADDPLLTRKEAMEEFEIPYWKIRDMQSDGRIPVFRSGKQMVSRKSDIEQYLREAGWIVEEAEEAVAE
jgi:hypothetical protein